MAKKNAARASTPAAAPATPAAATAAPPAAATSAAATSSSAPAPAPAAKTAPKASRGDAPLHAFALDMWDHYVKTTAQQTMLLDAFLAFLVVMGGLQVLYCVTNGTYPYNAFLAGFAGTVGQFVLTVSLRMQTNSENKSDFSKTSPERAFADYIFGSLVLHFFCVNYLN